jgi:translation initiation factor 3 subunit F
MGGSDALVADGQKDGGDRKQGGDRRGKGRQQRAQEA